MTTLSPPRWPGTVLTERVGVALPIIQAPMAGGPTTPALVAAVSNAGALGSLAVGTLSPATIASEIHAIRRLTSAPFGVNVFVVDPPSIEPAALQAAQARLRPFREALGLPDAEPPARFCESFAEQLEAVIEARPPVVSFTFGLVTGGVVERFHAQGAYVIGTATNADEARAWEAVGADAVCAQGAEAGGHRGTFLGGFEESTIGTMALVPLLIDAVRIPIIAAGGIMDGRGIAAALMLGACAAQLGTAFLTCPEAGTSAAWRASVATAKATRLTRAFSGKPARGIVNDFMERMRADEGSVPPYPIQNALTTPIRAAAARAGRGEFLSLWAGQAASRARALPAAELVQKLDAETRALLGG